MNNEILKDVIGYEGFYKVNQFGIVKSVAREVTFNRTIKGNTHSRTTIKKSQIMKFQIHFKGYKKVSMSKIIDGKHVQKALFLHRIVAMAFLPNPENLPQVNHKNGNKLDNSIENLEWVTNLTNMRHAINTGLRPETPLGENAYRAELTDLQVIDIKKRLKNNEAGKCIAEFYGMHESTISDIKRGKTWKSVQI